MAHPTQAREAPQPGSGRLWFPSLRTKLQVFAVSLVLVPSVLFAAIAVRRVGTTLERAVGRQLAEVAHDVLDEVTQAVRDERQNVRTWARQEIMRDVVIGDLDKRIARFLTSLREGGSPYRELMCVDGTGLVIAATAPAALNTRVADLPAVRAALSGDEFEGPVVMRADGAEVDLAAPIRDPERPDVIVGALVGGYDWRRAMTIAARIRTTLLPYGLRVGVVTLDAGGSVIGESWDEQADEGALTALHRSAVAAATRLPEARAGWFTDHHAGLLVGYERPNKPDVGWQALVLEPTSEAFAPVRTIERQLGILLAIVLIAAIAIATLLADRMSRPLRALTRAARTLARGGGPPAPVSVRARDEIGALADAFNTMTADLTRAQDDLLNAAKFAFVGEVAAGVAHEVRTPLGILRSSAQMLGRSLPSAEPQSRELVQMIVEEVDRLNGVVDGLLELARPHRPVIEPTPLAPVLTRALDFVEGQAREKHIALHRALGPYVARCDGEEIYQVALNLLVNALQILPAGGSIDVRTIARSPGYVGFEVTDDGPGIPPDAQPHIFTPFFTMRKGGTGLGLALVERTVRAHQGSVAVESAPGRGTTFRVELPQAEGA